MTKQPQPSPDHAGKGHERYDWYHYLWHLIAIRAVQVKAADADSKFEIEPDAWDKFGDECPGAGEIIAQIDTGVNGMHPNLWPRIRQSVDFAAHPFGVTHGTSRSRSNKVVDDNVLSKRSAQMRRGLESALEYSLIGDQTWRKVEALASPKQQQLVARLKQGRGIEQDVTSVSSLRYSAHGTACAGLMVGAPAAIASRGSDLGDGPIPYWGVAPGAELLPIVVSAQPSAEQLILAFLYAWDQSVSQSVSVIHFPREAPDPWRAHRYKPGYGDTRYEDPDAKEAWNLFEKVFEAVSCEIPIVCAAGNDGLDGVIYPAAKADEKNGIISVGAITYKAKRSSFSNYCGDLSQKALTIVAPSDDQEVYTRSQIRLDHEAAGWRDHNFAIHGHTIPPVDYAPQGILTVDIPGPRGYADGTLQQPQPGGLENEDRAALYTVFGGTSASSAIVAGAVALLQSLERSQSGNPLKGPRVKEKLMASGVRQVNWSWLVGPIEPDRMNGEDSVDFEQQFGGGLLDLDKLLT